MYSKQHKRKKLLTSISTIALTTILAFTSIPLTNVYATEKTNPTSKTEKDTVLGDRADNGGEGSSSTDKYIDADDSWQPVPGFDISHSGYRMYIINEDLQRISPIYDFVFSVPNAINYKYETRFDSDISPKVNENEVIHLMDTLKTWCTNDLTTKSWTDVPKPVIGNGGAEGHDSNGTTFKEWFLNGNPNLGTVTEKAYDTIINSSTGNGSTTTQGNKTGTSDESTEPEYKEVVPMTYLSMGNEIVNNTYEVEENTLDKYFGNPVKDALELLCSPYRSTYIAKVKKYYKECPGSSLENCSKAAVGDLSRYYKENILNYLYHNTVVDVSGLRETKTSYNSLDNLLQSNIPLAAQEDINGNFKNFGGLEDVIWTEDLANTPAYVLINSDATLQIPESYGAWPGQAIEEKNCALIVEPIFWIAIKTHESNDTEHTFNGKYYTKGYVYGTLWNLLNYPWKGGHGTYGELLSIVMCNSLANNKDYVVKSTGKTIKGVTPKQKYNPLSKAVDSMNDGYGLGLHVYDSEAFKKTTSSTQTYDKGLGETIGAAPDPTNLPTESQYPISKNITIIKNYVTVDSLGNETVDGNFIRNQNPHIIQILDEPLYKVVDWQTDNKTTSILSESDNGNTTITYNQLVQNSSKIQSGTTENVVQLSENEFVLYVKLLKQETPPPSNTRLTGDYILNESELAKAFQITPISIEYTFPKISFSESRGCGGHYNHRDTDGDGIDDDYDTCGGASSSSGYISDSKAKVTLKNEAESSYSNIIVQSDKAKFKSDMTVVELDRGSNADSFNTSANHKYTFNVYRYQQGEQNLTLCKYWQKQSSNKDVSVGTTQLISSSNKSVAKTLGYSEANSKSTKSRAEIDYIVNAVKFKFIFDTSSPDKSTSYYLHGDGCSCGGVHVGGYSRGKDIDTATIVESEADISVQVYSGTTSKPVHNKLWTETIGRNGEKYLPIRDNNNKTVGRQVQSTSTIKFNPFIKMTYSIVDDLKNNTIKKYPVNVLSEYQREILNTDYAEVSWQYRANKDNLSLLSNMWATDEVLTDGDDSWRQKNQVLKGGASAALQIKDSDMRVLTLRTYQTVFPDSDINAYLTNATNYSVNKAVQEHDTFIQSAVDTFEQLHVVQRVSTRIEDSIDDMADENKVERGGNISFLNNNSTTSSSDSKYYLSKDLSGLNAGANEGDLDVKLGSTSKKFFKVWSDTSGNILIAEGTDINALKNNISGTVILTKNQDSSSLTNQTAIDLNNRTFIVDKLINAVERNTGNDTSAEWASSDGKWYNESFALYCMTQATDIRLGFRDVNTRAFVLDAKLCPYLSSKSQQGKTAHTSIFSTDSYSEKWGSSEEGRVGTFKGKPIYMEDMQRLFTSKLFYIPNMTVQGSR